MHETYVFRFTRAKFEPYDGIQLGGIALRSTAGDLLPIVSISNPGETAHGGDGCAKHMGDMIRDQRAVIKEAWAEATP